MMLKPNKALLSDQFPLRYKFAAERGVKVIFMRKIVALILVFFFSPVNAGDSKLITQSNEIKDGEEYFVL